jgi:hypothetical protein
MNRRLMNRRITNRITERIDRITLLTDAYRSPTAPAKCIAYQE